MSIHTTTALKYAFGSAMALTIVSSAADAAEDDGLVITRVQRSVEVQLNGESDSGSSSDVSQKSWNNEISMTNAGDLTAHQSSTIDESFMESTMSVNAGTRGGQASAHSVFEVDFKIERTDYSRPDEHSSWEGQSPLESLFQDGLGPTLDQQPAYQMHIHSILRYEGLSPNAGFPESAMDENHMQGRNGAYGYTLHRNDELFSWHQLEPQRRHGDGEHTVILELPPGDYTLRVECGLQNDRRQRYGRMNGHVLQEFQAELSPMELGYGEVIHDDASRTIDVNAGEEAATWVEDPFSDEEWMFRQAHDSGNLANGGSVVNVETSGYHGYLFSRTSYDKSSNESKSVSNNQFNASFTLPHDSEVGIASLSFFANESDYVNKNKGNVVLQLTSRDSGDQVFQMTSASKSVVSNTESGQGFDENKDWINLPAGTYDLEVEVTSSSLRTQGADTGNEVSFWFALITHGRY